MLLCEVYLKQLLGTETFCCVVTEFYFGFSLLPLERKRSGLRLKK